MQVTWQRYEAKFMVDEQTAARVTHYCRTNLRFDPHCEKRAAHQYPIHSIYLDSPDFTLARSVVDRRTDRFKLRIRTYREIDEPADGLPTFFEIKRKCRGIVHKSRVKLLRDDAERVLWHNTVPDSVPECGDDTAMDNLCRFLELRREIQASPVLSVHYRREAYESDFGQRVRVSFDRQLAYGLLDFSNGTIRESWWPVRLRGVIMEIKFTDTYPSWVESLLERSDAVRRGVCKYLICSQAANGLIQPLEEARSA